MRNESARLNPQLSPFIAGYVLVPAVLGPLAAGRARWLQRLLPGGRRPPGGGSTAWPAAATGA